MNAPALHVEELAVSYSSDTDRGVAVSGVSLTIEPGRMVALVGESGSGKTTVATAIAGLLPPAARISPDSRIAINGVDIVGVGEPVLRTLRGSVVGFVPQDPRRSLHPLKRIGVQIGEVLLHHRVCAKDDVDEQVAALLTKVGIDNPGARARQYPHEFSGGMLQRVLIAIAVAARPSLIIADEPTSALDVTVQKQVLDLLRQIVADDAVAVLLVTHDLELAAVYSDHTVVLHRGRVVEKRATAALFASPVTEYTRALLQSSPRLIPRRPRSDRPDRVPLLAVEGVRKEVRLPGEGWWQRKAFTPVDDVSFAVARSSTVAIVGESGAGKTTLTRLALGLERPDAGRVIFDGADVHRLNRAGRKEFRRATQLIPQNPASSFDPRYTVGQVIGEPLRYAGSDRRTAERRVQELLDQVGLPASFARRSALDLSGGQQQRVAIARAISLGPKLLVCDEPTSALDVTTQARIIELLRRLRTEIAVSYLFISHNLAVVSELADEVVVLRSGQVVEAGQAYDVLEHPRSEYTRALLDSVPNRQLNEIS